MPISFPNAIEFAAQNHGLQSVTITVLDLSDPVARYRATARFAFNTERSATGVGPSEAFEALVALVQADVDRWQTQCQCPEHCPREKNPDII